MGSYFTPDDELSVACQPKLYCLRVPLKELVDDCYRFLLPSFPVIEYSELGIGSVERRVQPDGTEEFVFGLLQIACTLEGHAVVQYECRAIWHRFHRPTA